MTRGAFAAEIGGPQASLERERDDLRRRLEGREREAEAGAAERAQLQAAMREAEATVDGLAKVLETERAQARKAAQEAAEVRPPRTAHPCRVVSILAGGGHFVGACGEALLHFLRTRRGEELGRDPRQGWRCRVPAPSAACAGSRSSPTPPLLPPAMPHR